MSTAENSQQYQDINANFSPAPPQAGEAESELSAEEQALVKEELQVLEQIKEKLSSELKRLRGRHYDEQKRARELTSELVAATRDEDKAMLASDEAVSHALSDRAYEQVKVVEQLLKKPYFARFQVEEELEDGSDRVFEYRLGFSSNPDCRIIDWRKAPISKLYYEYKEGDEYDEEIQGRSRFGRVLMRRGVEIEDGELTKISYNEGNLFLLDGEWRKDQASEMRRAGRMRDILSLITPEQFRLITEDAESAIILQGVAGSGKTTVALHRLAWLLHEDNSELQQRDCLVLALSPSLKIYVRQVLEALKLEHVQVKTFADWKGKLLSSVLPKSLLDDDNIRRPKPEERAPSALQRFKHSASVITGLEHFVLEQKAAGKLQSVDYHKLLLEFFMSRSFVEKELEHGGQRDEFIRNEDFQLAQKRIRFCAANNLLDYEDDALVLRIATLLGHSAVQEYGHIVLDETQDYSSSELAAILGMAKSISNTTIVGDASQAVSDHGAFPGWDKLLRRWDVGEEQSHFVSLTVSHRSTLPIMKLADAVQSRSVVTEGRDGKKPIWFRCRKDDSALRAAIDWLGKATKRFPNEITAVICSNNVQARELYQLLRPSFGESIRLGSPTNFSFEQGILVTDVQLARGLEFFNVLVWDCSPRNFSNDDKGRNKLYIATTRAEENLSFVSARHHSRLLGAATPYLREIREAEEEKEDGDS